MTNRTELEKMIEQLWTDIDVRKGRSGFFLNQPIDDLSMVQYGGIYLQGEVTQGVTPLTLSVMILRHETRNLAEDSDVQNLIVQKCAEQLIAINQRIRHRYWDYASNGFEPMTVMDMSQKDHDIVFNDQFERGFREAQRIAKQVDDVSDQHAQHEEFYNKMTDAEREEFRKRYEWNA